MKQIQTLAKPEAANLGEKHNEEQILKCQPSYLHHRHVETAYKRLLHKYVAQRLTRDFWLAHEALSERAFNEYRTSIPRLTKLVMEKENALFYGARVHSTSADVASFVGGAQRAWSCDIRRLLTIADILDYNTSFCASSMGTGAVDITWRAPDASINIKMHNRGLELTLANVNNSLEEKKLLFWLLSPRRRGFSALLGVIGVYALYAVHLLCWVINLPVQRGTESHWPRLGSLLPNPIPVSSLYESAAEHGFRPSLVLTSKDNEQWEAPADDSDQR